MASGLGAATGSSAPVRGNLCSHSCSAAGRTRTSTTSAPWFTRPAARGTTTGAPGRCPQSSPWAERRATGATDTLTSGAAAGAAAAAAPQTPWGTCVGPGTPASDCDKRGPRARRPSLGRATTASPTPGRGLGVPARAPPLCAPGHLQGLRRPHHYHGGLPSPPSSPPPPPRGPPSAPGPPGRLSALGRRAASRGWPLAALGSSCVCQ